MHNSNTKIKSENLDKSNDIWFLEADFTFYMTDYSWLLLKLINQASFVLLTRDERCYDERQNHQLQKPHKKLSWICNVWYLHWVKFVFSQKKSNHDTQTNPCEGDDEQHVPFQPRHEQVDGHLLHLRFHLEFSGFCKINTGQNSTRVNPSDNLG